MEELDQLARQINGFSVVVVLGATDVGKTTLVRQLHERIGGDVIDADLGQAEIGPPGVISLGTFSEGARVGYFVGDISPGGHFLQLLSGCYHMARKANRPCLIDTDGYVDDGAACALKSELINLIRPHVIILLQRAHELNYYGIYERKGVTVVKLRVRHSGFRSHEERIQKREERFRRYFARAELRRWDLWELALESSELRWGELLDTKKLAKNLGSQVMTGWRSGREATLIVNGEASEAQGARVVLGVDRLKIFQHSALENLLLGCFLGDEFQGLGILKSISGATVQVLSPVPRSTILQVGFLRVRDDGSHTRIALQSLTEHL